ncbi:unnamed protein product [Ambrosiozyma monospora]|uniref:Unnamed protein product n=1 Tax=Ambrosiozyma monospora TaxID=43982 RepID=A0A9W6Z7B5_AMBMO|nr:unnamed protein product [Ambrosiozyma monospora]
MSFNLSATLNIIRLVLKPELCLPHLTVPNFNQMPIPVTSDLIPKDKIKAIVLDKDNCIAKDHDDKVWHEYIEHWEQLKKLYPNANQLLIVSNSAGTNDDKQHQQANLIEQRTGVTILRHSTKKPGCHVEIMNFFREKGICKSPSEVVIVGDRLFTDVLMANMMGSYGIWLNPGVHESNSVICRLERYVHSMLLSRNYQPPIPGATAGH